MAGLGGFVFSMYLFTPITHEWGWQELLFPQAIRGISQQFAMAPIVTLTLGGIPKERLKLASGVFNLTRNLGGAIGIAFVALFSIIELIFIFREWVKKWFLFPIR